MSRNTEEISGIYVPSKIDRSALTETTSVNSLLYVITFSANISVTPREIIKACVVNWVSC